MMEVTLDFSRRIPPHWYPWKIFRGQAPGDAGKNRIRWCYTGDKPFTESFYEETLRSQLHRDENRNFTQHFSLLENLPQAAAGFEAVQPRALIFHISRCGSTLLSQLLASDARAIVLSEVPALDQLLAEIHHAKQPFAVTQELVQALVNVLGQKRTGAEDRVFIKLDSWHVFYYDLLRKIYPAVPFLFLYRDPVEVFHSHVRRPGMQMLSQVVDASLFGIGEGIQGVPQRYIAAVLGRYLEEFRRIAAQDPLVMPADYSEGIDAVTNRLLDRAGIAAGDEWREKMAERLSFHSKYPGQRFTGDPASGALPDFLQETILKYRQLSALGQKKSRG